jgi:Acetyl-coenzyme A synthetase N-terminus
MVEATDSKYITYGERSCNDFKNPKLEAIYKSSIEDKPGFFAKLAENVHWHKKFTKVLDDSDQYMHRWFPDGEINITYNCLDRHVNAGHGD